MCNVSSCLAKARCVCIPRAGRIQVCGILRESTIWILATNFARICSLRICLDLDSPQISSHSLPIANCYGALVDPSKYQRRVFRKLSECLKSFFVVRNIQLETDPFTHWSIHSNFVQEIVTPPHGKKTRRLPYLFEISNSIAFWNL